jgi:intracellular septation protein A
MNRLELLKRMLPGFIPLFAYIAADELWGESIGLIVGIGIGFAEFALIFVRERRPDWLALADAALLGLLGGVSFLVSNASFFRLKPAIAELVMLVLVLFSAFGPADLLFKAAARKMGCAEALAAAEKPFRASLTGFAIVLAAHTALSFYAAFFMEKEAWAFVTGGLFYIAAGLWALGASLRRRLRRQQ